MITIKLKNNQYQLSEQELELVTVDEWYLSMQVKYIDSSKNIEIDEEYQIFKDILDSFKFRTFIISDLKKINYYLELGKKWLLPDWLMELIEERKKDSDSFQNLKKIIIDYQKCVNCGVFFKESENNSEACHFHPGQLVSGNYSCCGYRPSQFNYELKYCSRGYHGVDQYSYAILFKKYQDILKLYQK